ncbi:MAG: hypothetical protein HQ595_01965 [Candidatus Omnitrophica bacterium]|nr:hypothetical protein [Candidatus Omnitrophota bacterium]
MSVFKDCPGSKRIKSPFPEEITCLCGKVVEIWSDETSSTCKHCQRKLTREMLPNCLDWCAVAKDCVGDVKYKRYLQSKKGEKSK